MRIRQRKIAIIADIKEMLENTRDNAPPEEFGMASLIFGAMCSPSIIYVNNCNGMKHVAVDPEAGDVVVRIHYVDDLLNDAEEGTIHSAERVLQIHKEAYPRASSADIQLRHSLERTGIRHSETSNDSGHELLRSKLLSLMYLLYLILSNHNTIKIKYKTIYSVAKIHLAHAGQLEQMLVQV